MKRNNSHVLTLLETEFLVPKQEIIYWDKISCSHFYSYKPVSQVNWIEFFWKAKLLIGYH